MKKIFLHPVIFGLFLLVSSTLLVEEWFKTMLQEAEHTAYNLEEDVEVYESTDLKKNPFLEGGDYSLHGYGLPGIIEQEPLPAGLLATELHEVQIYPKIARKLYVLFHCFRFHC